MSLPARLLGPQNNYTVSGAQKETNLILRTICRVTANIVNAGDSRENQIVVAAKHGFALVDRTTGALSYIQKVWDDPAKEHR